LNGTFATNYDRQKRSFKRAVSKNEVSLVKTLAVTSVERDRRENSIKKIEDSAEKSLFKGHGDYQGGRDQDLLAKKQLTEGFHSRLRS
jgi:hypothetical protein